MTTVIKSAQPDRAFRVAILSLSLMAGASCSSAPTRFYALSADASDVARSQDQTPHPRYVVILTQASIPENADRLQITVHRTATRVELLEHDQWAQPLSDLITDVLVRDLRTRLAGVDVVSDARLAGNARPLSVVVEIERFDAFVGREVTVSARWTISADENAPTVVERRSETRPIANDDADTVVKAWSDSLSEVARVMANSIDTFDEKTLKARNGDGQCH